jgi:hypothetical protein
MKTPIQRLRELTKVLKDKENIVIYDKTLLNGFIIEAIWQPKVKTIFLMNDYADSKTNKVIYLEDKDVSDIEILEIVEDLEAML